LLLILRSMERIDVDIEKAAWDLAAFSSRENPDKELEKAMEMPVAFKTELMELMAKHNIGNIMKVPDWMIGYFIFGVMNQMSKLFAGYIMETLFELFPYNKPKQSPNSSQATSEPQQSANS